MTKLRALATLLALAAIAVVTPAAAQAAPLSSSTVISSQESWRWQD